MVQVNPVKNHISDRIKLCIERNATINESATQEKRQMKGLDNKVYAFKSTQENEQKKRFIHLREVGGG